MVTVITVNITNFNNHYHVVILKIVSITMFCSDLHYTVFTVYMPRESTCAGTHSRTYAYSRARANTQIKLAFQLCMAGTPCPDIPDIEISVEGVAHQLAILNPSKSGGPDEIPHDFLKNWPMTWLPA